MICLPPAKKRWPGPSDPDHFHYSFFIYQSSVFNYPMPYPFTEPAVTPSIR